MTSDALAADLRRSRLALLSALRLGFSSTRFAFTTLSLALMHGPHQPMSEKGSHLHRPIAGQSPHRQPIRSDYNRRLEMAAGANGRCWGNEAEGRGDVFAGARARSLARSLLRFFLC